jgi:two-component system, NtrC family, nitrogen regulation response regulator GlnG
MKNVLFINKDGNVQERVREILNRRDDFSLVTADSTDEAERIIIAGGIDFVLFDVDVAMSEGVNRMIELKDKYPDLPIVATTPIRRPEEEK